MDNTLIKDIEHLARSLNQGEVSGKLSYKDGSRMDALSTENSERIVKFIEEVTGNIFVRKARKGTSRQKDSPTLLHVESGKTFKIHAAGKRGDILGITAALNCIFKGCPASRDKQAAFFYQRTPDDYVDNAPYIIIINLDNALGSRFSIAHVLDLDLHVNIAGKLQTDFTLAEKRTSPQELLEKIMELQEASIQKDINVLKAQKTFLMK